jgi:hypothetical protein
LRPHAFFLANGVSVARHGEVDDVGEKVTRLGVPLHSGSQHVAKHSGGYRFVTVGVRKA